MKPLLKGILAIALLAIAATTPAFAYDHIQYDDSYWPRSYYINAAFGTFFTWGDVNERPITVTDSIDEKQMARTEAIILSMTPQERSNPDILNLSRKQRIAKGCGVDISEVNKLVKQFEQARKMMKQFGGLMGGKGRKGLGGLGGLGGLKLPF